jgi:hypothetical protein
MAVTQLSSIVASLILVYGSQSGYFGSASATDTQE